MLKNIEFKGVYSTEEDDLLNDFYIPALKSSIRYDRAVGYFSSGVFFIAGQGLSAFIKNEGKIRLLIGATLSTDDYDNFLKGYKQKELNEKIGTFLIEDIKKFETDLYNLRLDSISWLIAHNRLDIKIGIREEGIFHDKIGILKDLENNKVVFTGSANETVKALESQYNFESINVYPDWIESFKRFYEPHINKFENLWSNKVNNTAVVDLPQISREYFEKRGRNLDSPPSTEDEIKLYQKYVYQKREETIINLMKPHVPNKMHDQEFKIKKHQRSALIKWKDNKYKGIMALATGSGKTITSIYGLVKLYEAKKKLFVFIAVPYVNLADQWVDELKNFNIFPIQCYNKKENWEKKLSSAIYDYDTGISKFECVIVVNKTLSSESFQNYIQKLNSTNIIWIGDECHHHGSENLNNSLPEFAEYRIGLSATPKHYINEDINNRLIDYYGKIVANYELEDALKDGVLCPYEYHVLPVELSPEEQEDYYEISQEIGKQFQYGDLEFNTFLQQLLSKRARLIGNAINKIQVLKKIISEKKPEDFSLFYCGDGSFANESNEGLTNQINEISKLLYDNKWNTSKFTCYETKAERKKILDNFKFQIINAMIAIRCLDEGIDIPACKTAYLLASSRNPRQFIQRRGRILRKHPSKSHSVIYDFFVHIPKTKFISDYDKRLIRNEIERVSEFTKLSLNPTQSYGSLKSILKEYDMIELL